MLGQLVRDMQPPPAANTPRQRSRRSTRKVGRLAALTVAAVLAVTCSHHSTGGMAALQRASGFNDSGSADGFFERCGSPLDPYRGRRVGEADSPGPHGEDEEPPDELFGQEVDEAASDYFDEPPESDIDDGPHAPNFSDEESEAGEPRGEEDGSGASR